MKRVNVKGQARWVILPLLSVVCAAGASADTSLIEAVKEQDTATARMLIEANVDVNVPQSDGATALGRYLKAHEGVILGGLRFERGGKTGNSRRWRVRRVAGEEV